MWLRGERDGEAQCERRTFAGYSALRWPVVPPGHVPLVSRDERQPNLLLRQARGDLSQASLAELVNAEIYRSTGQVGAITAKSISDWERGWYTLPREHVRSALSKVLDVAGPEELGFHRRRTPRQDRAEQHVPLPLQESLIAAATSNEGIPFGTVGYLEIPGGQSFLGAGMVVHYCAAKVGEHGRVTPQLTEDAATVLNRPDFRTMLIAQVPDLDEGDLYLSDGREFAGQRPTPGQIPAAFVLDDFTVGLIWAITNTDTAILADDAALDTYQRGLTRYEQLTASAATTSEAPELNSVSQRWLGSYFCASHISRNLSRLSPHPMFWTREQRGEEAASWLLWSHKLDYLRHTARTLPSARRGFCVPEHQLESSPRYERVVLLLAIALMEAFGITVEVNAEPDLADVEGFVLGDAAIVANFLRAPGLWYVETSAPRSRRTVYAEVDHRSSSRSIIAQSTSARRLEAMAGYLNIPWSWFRRRCRDLTYAGVDGIARPRSRLLSTEGLATAIRYVAYLDKTTSLQGDDLARS